MDRLTLERDEHPECCGEEASLVSFKHRRAGAELTYLCEVCGEELDAHRPYTGVPWQVLASF